jgi:hypothetical protein
MLTSLRRRLRAPFERLAAEPRDPRSALRASLSHAAPRGDSPRPSLVLLPAGLEDEYVGLDRLDREELDETD